MLGISTLVTRPPYSVKNYFFVNEWRLQIWSSSLKNMFFYLVKKHKARPPKSLKKLRKKIVLALIYMNIYFIFVYYVSDGSYFLILVYYFFSHSDPKLRWIYKSWMKKMLKFLLGYKCHWLFVFYYFCSKYKLAYFPIKFYAGWVHISISHHRPPNFAASVLQT